MLTFAFKSKVDKFKLLFIVCQTKMEDYLLCLVKSPVSQTPSEGSVEFGSLRLACLSSIRHLK